MAEAARIHHAAQATIPGYPNDLHTLDDCQAFYREQVWPGSVLTGAFDGAHLVGLVAMRPGWIDHLYVDPPRHGRGMGRRLLGHAMASADELQLWTFHANHGARRFYERAGFAAVEETDGSGNGARLPDVRYRWRRY